MPRGRRCSSRTEARAQPAPAAPPRLVPKPRAIIPSSEASLHEASNEGSHRSPVRSSPRLRPPGWNEPPLGLSPKLRTPPTKSRTTHVGVGTGQRARARNYTLNITSGLILQSVVHSLRATSRRSAHSETVHAGGRDTSVATDAGLADRPAIRVALLLDADRGRGGFGGRPARRAGAVVAGCATVVSAVPEPATGVLTSQRRARNAVRAADPDRRSATSKADAGKTIDSAGARRADPRSRCPRHVPIAPRGVPAPARSLQRAAA